VEQRNGFGGLLFADLDVDANTAAGRMVLSLMASVAEFEARRAETITRNDAAPDRTTAESERLRPVLKPMAARGESLRAMAAALAGLGITTRSGQPLSPSGVRNHLQRLGLRTAG
jgi:hypothetical protein